MQKIIHWNFAADKKKIIFYNWNAEENKKLKPAQMNYETRLMKKVAGHRKITVMYVLGNHRITD
jgi:hypothetical protein